MFYLKIVSIVGRDRLAEAKNVPLDIAAGSHDGAPIPIWHSLVAFNVIAEAVGDPGITAEEIDQLSHHEPGLDNPRESDRVVDPSFGRRILLRRFAGESRITIFEGAHDVIPAATLAWFDAH